ncbi:EamA family transporter [Saccharopolyspora tripterygii]
MLLAAVCGQVLGWLLVALCLAQIPSHVGAVLLLLTPVGALILGGVVLGERPGALQLLGSALLCASVVVTRRRAEKEKPR